MVSGVRFCLVFAKGKLLVLAVLDQFDALKA